jgi:hypothetical protein
LEGLTNTTDVFKEEEEEEKNKVLTINPTSAHICIQYLLLKRGQSFLISRDLPSLSLTQSHHAALLRQNTAILFLWTYIVDMGKKKW